MLVSTANLSFIVMMPFANSRVTPAQMLFKNLAHVNFSMEMKQQIKPLNKFDMLCKEAMRKKSISFSIRIQVNLN